ncbi:MAG: exodeoxyribonuclease VII small subunit [Cellvibrionales bacterium]|nr:exodeoxyribonuclease VII small subunit [Cellvibrionales bacterium]
MPKPQKPSFDKSLSELEALVAKIDSGELNLEDALAAFEKGVGLVRDCQKSLNEAEQTVNRLVADSEGLSLEPLDDRAQDDD